MASLAPLIVILGREQVSLQGVRLWSQLSRVGREKCRPDSGAA